MIRIKYSLLLVLFFSNFSLYSQDDDYLFLKYDRVLISLWDAADKQDVKLCEVYLNLVNEELGNVKAKLQKRRISHLDHVQFSAHALSITRLLKTYVTKKDYKRIKFFCYDLLQENYGVRNCLQSEIYPLDKLIELKEAYKVVVETVNDPMMKLLEWFEFIDIVDQMISRFEDYNCIEDKIITNYLPHFRITKHASLKMEANICIEDFIESVESGYQQNFTSPCLELGKAIDNILILYK